MTFSKEVSCELGEEKVWCEWGEGSLMGHRAACDTTLDGAVRSNVTVIVLDYAACRSRFICWFIRMLCRPVVLSVLLVLLVGTE